MTAVGAVTGPREGEPVYAGLMLPTTEEAPARMWRVRGILVEVNPSHCFIGLRADLISFTYEDEVRVEAPRVALASVPLASMLRVEPRDWTAFQALNPWPHQAREIAQLIQRFSDMEQSAPEPASSGEIAPLPGPRLSANPVAARPPLASATRTGAASSYAPAAEGPAGLSGWLTGAGSLLAGGGGDVDEACDGNELIGGPWSAALPLAAPLATSPRESDEEKKLKAAFAAGSTPIQLEFATSKTARHGSAAPAAAVSTGIFSTRSSARARQLDPAALPRGVIDLDATAWVIRPRSHSPPTRAEALGGQPPWQPDEKADHPPGDAPQPCKGAGEGRA